MKTFALLSTIGSTYASFNQIAHTAHVGNDGRVFQGQLDSAIDSLNEMGCWCYFDNDHGRGKGKPVDEIDGFCKILHDGYECAMRDAENEGTTCIPWEVEYKAAVGGSLVTTFEACQAANSDKSNCAVRACTVEGTFVENITAFLVFNNGGLDDSKRHSNGFDPKVGCPTKTGGSGSSEVQCCGTYPVRYPFKTLDGERACCGQRTFSSLALSCCAEETSTVKFNC